MAEKVGGTTVTYGAAYVPLHYAYEALAVGPLYEGRHWWKLRPLSRSQWIKLPTPWPTKWSERHATFSH